MKSRVSGLTLHVYGGVSGLRPIDSYFGSATWKTRWCGPSFENVALKYLKQIFV